MKKQAMILFLSVLVALMISACGDDGGPTTPSRPATPPPAPQPVIERFTLSAADGFIEYSSPLATPSVGESIDIRFTPLAIRRGNSGFASVVEFWVDRGPEDNGIAMGLIWLEGDMWGVYRFTRAEGFVDLFGLFRIEVGGDFHTVTIRREQGFTEWLLDGDSLVVISKTRRTVYTRVVGTRTRFEYEVPPDFLSRGPRALGLGLDLLGCGPCVLRKSKGW